MLNILGTILGNSTVIEKGMELIDDAFTSEEEARESKTEAKIKLLNAYAPFKVAQRYLALMFGATFLISFFLVLVMTLGSWGNVDNVYKIIDEFMIDWIMTAIVTFYFGGGLAESVKRK